MKGKKRAWRLWALAAAGSLMISGAAAVEGFDVGQYSYEELTEIKELVEGRLFEMNRQYALEHADRTIAFETEETVVFLGETVQILPQVEVIAEGAPETTELKWSSSDPEIAKAEPDGKVTALAKGDAVITATMADNEYLYASYTVHTAVKVDQVTVWGPGELILGGAPEEAEAALGYDIEPEDAYYQQVTWASSDESIATVDENGRVTAVASGEVMILATSEEPVAEGRAAKRASFAIRVAQRATGLELDAAEMTLEAGTSGKLAATLSPENATNPAVNFISGDEAVATVSADGTVTAVEAGACDIRCEAADGSGIAAICHVTVIRKVTGITLNEKELSLGIGEVREIEATVSPENATNRDLMWTSSNVFVARVAKGKIEAVGQGECEITCTASDGSGSSAVVTVRVPTFSMEERAYTVTEKSGLEIPIRRNRPEVQLVLAGGSECFTAELTENGLRIMPLAAGSGTVTVVNPAEEKDNTLLQITVEDSAVYNQVSYPPVAYMELLGEPDKYEGAQISIRGKVLSIETGEEGQLILVVGTSGKDYTDQVFTVRCGAELVKLLKQAGLAEPERELAAGDMITVYGLYRLDREYSEVLQAETTAPAIEAEKVE